MICLAAGGQSPSPQPANNTQAPKVGKNKPSKASKKDASAQAVKQTGVGKPTASKAGDSSTDAHISADGATKKDSSTLRVEGDYIPCKFTVTELQTLVNPEVAPTLTAADEENLKESVTETVTTQNNDPLLKGRVLNDFLNKLSDSVLAGLTPSEALNRIIAMLAHSRELGLSPATDKDVRQLGEEIKAGRGKASDVDDLNVDNFIAYLAKDETGLVGKISVNGLNAAAVDKISAWENQNQDFVKMKEDLKNSIDSATLPSKKSLASQVTSKDLSEFASAIKDTGAATGSALKPDIESFTTYLSDPSHGIVGVIPEAGLKQKAHDQVDLWAEQSPAVTKIEANLKSLITAAKPLDFSAIIDAARGSLELLERPKDVGCAMSILTYSEADTAFGYKIANHYIAVQIVVRNLNRDKAFVLHDAEFQVNSDPAGGFGRFYSGRDKVIVRALSAAQSDFDPRAIVVHAAEGVGAILSATVPIFNVATLTNASAVFNGAFVPGLDKYWKDQTGNQLNLLNDVGFSSQQSSQTTVPQLGTTMFVIFIPEKPFEEGWWTQPCVEKTYVGTTIDGHGNARLPQQAGGLTSNDLSADAKGDGGQSTEGEHSGNEHLKSTAPRLQVIAAKDRDLVQRAIEVCSSPGEIPYRSKRLSNWWRFGHRQEDDRVGYVETTSAESSPGLSGPNATASANKGGSVAKPIENEGASTCKVTGDTTTTCPPPKKVVCSTAGYSPECQISRQQDWPPPEKMDLFRNAYPRPYKKWPGRSLELFAALTNAVVAGTHITEDSQLQSSITEMKCSTDKLGNLTYPTPDTGSIVCTLAGKNLDKVSQLRLRNAKDVTDTTTVEGTVSVSGDSKKGEVKFLTSELQALPQRAYSVFTLSSNGVEEKTGQSVHLLAVPRGSKVNPPELDFSLDAKTVQPITIEGTHLGDVDSVTLTDKSDSKKTVVIPMKLDALKSDTKLTVNVDPTKISGLSDTSVTYTISVEESKVSTQLTPTLSIKGPAAKQQRPAKGAGKRKGA